MAAKPSNRLPEMSPWRRHPLTIPPDSFDAWARLAVWECWMGVLVYGALRVAAHLIRTAPNNIITVFDLKNCYAAAPVIQPCERVAYRAGALNVAPWSVERTTYTLELNPFGPPPVNRAHAK